MTDHLADCLRERFKQLSFDEPTILESVLRSAAYAVNSPALTTPLLSTYGWMLHCDRFPEVVVVNLQHCNVHPEDLLGTYCEVIYRLTGICEVRFMCRNDLVWTATRQRERVWQAILQNGGAIA